MWNGVQNDNERRVGVQTQLALRIDYLIQLTCNHNWCLMYHFCVNLYQDTCLSNIEIETVGEGVKPTPDWKKTDTAHGHIILKINGP